MTKIRTHEVATSAYQVVDARKDPELSATFRKKYGALAHKLPGMVLQNGLAQATGFLLAKGKAEHLALLEDLTRVLKATGATTVDEGTALHAEIIAADLAKTMHLTRRTLEATGWIKRYVQGVLGVDATGDSSADDLESAVSGGGG